MFKSAASRTFTSAAASFAPRRFVHASARALVDKPASAPVAGASLTSGGTKAASAFAANTHTATKKARITTSPPVLDSPEPGANANIDQSVIHEYPEPHEWPADLLGHNTYASFISERFIELTSLFMLGMAQMSMSAVTVAARSPRSP